MHDGSHCRPPPPGIMPVLVLNQRHLCILVAIYSCPSDTYFCVMLRVMLCVRYFVLWFVLFFVWCIVCDTLCCDLCCALVDALCAILCVVLWLILCVMHCVMLCVRYSVLWFVLCFVWCIVWCFVCVALCDCLSDILRDSLCGNAFSVMACEASIYNNYIVVICTRLLVLTFPFRFRCPFRQNRRMSYDGYRWCCPQQWWLRSSRQFWGTGPGEPFGL